MMTMKGLLLALISIILPISLMHAQEVQIKSDFQGRHHMKDPSELQRMDEVGKGFLPTNAPVAPVRNIAEFNRMGGVLIAYDGGFGIPLALIAEMSQDTKVWTIVSSNSIKNYVTSLYQSAGVNLANAEFLVKPINSYWTRDYGPWFIIDGNNEVGVVNFPYNRPRPYDDAIPGHIANEFGLNLYNMNLIHTGGNYMTDGMGVSASTDLVADENPALSSAQIDQLVSDYLGVHTYYLNDDPLGLYIEHIDCWGKFLDVDKILIAEVPPSDPRYSDYEAVASFYSSHLSSYGTPYEVHRAYSPNGQPYTNSLILNNKVLVPVVSGSGSNWNDTAIARYEQAMPGYDVIPFTQYNAAPWQTTDALHCRAKGLADTYILDILHAPVVGDQAPSPQFNLSARIVATSGQGLVEDSIYCKYRLNGGSWSIQQMQPDTGMYWSCSLPGFSAGTDIDYVIYAQDSSGRKESHPFIGDADPHQFAVRNIVNIPEEKQRTRLRIYPNPAEDHTFINFSSWEAGPVTISVYTLEGKLLYSRSWTDIPPGKHQWPLNTASWPGGLYLLSIHSAHGKFTSQLVVK